MHGHTTQVGINSCTSLPFSPAITFSLSLTHNYCGVPQRVLDTLIRDGADVHRQNKFKNTPWDVASSAECRRLLKTTAAFPAPSVEEAEAMHRKNLQVGGNDGGRQSFKLNNFSGTRYYPLRKYCSNTYIYTSYMFRSIYISMKASGRVIS